MIKMVEIEDKVFADILVTLHDAIYNGNIYVSDVGKFCRIDKRCKRTHATLVVEEDNSVRWYLSPDERSDWGLISVRVNINGK